jgi:di/tricarboxylate transporter
MFLMDWQAWFVVSLVAGTLSVLVAVPRFGPDIVLMAALVVLSVSGILAPEQALAGFANPGVITIAALFIVADAIRACGGVDYLVRSVLGEPGGHRRALVRMMVPVALVSGFVNNTPVVAALIPAVGQWAKRLNLRASDLMIPLSYASILGGTLTLIGTSTSLVVNGQYRALTGEAGFALFDLAPIGVINAIAGIAFVVLLGPLLLKARPNPSETFADKRRFTFEVAVAADGPLPGRNIQQAGLRALRDIYLAEIERDGTVLTAVAPEEVLRAGDRLVFVGETDAIVGVLSMNGIVPAVGSEPTLEREFPQRVLMQAVVSPRCELLGRTIRDGRFRDRYGAAVLAVARNGEHVTGRLSSIELEQGDVLLLEGAPDVYERLNASRDFILINKLDHKLPEHRMAARAWIVMVAMLLLAAFGVLSMMNAALLAAGAMLVLRCTTIGEARRSLDLQVLVTVAASFALGAALEETGAAAYFGERIVAGAGGDAWLLLLLTYVSVMLLTELITNTAAALLMLPVVLAMAASAGLNAEPFVLAVMMAASASFATPIGYQCNLMVYGPGGYRFGDFLRIGVPLNLVCCAVTVLMLPYLWPLSG